MEDSNNKELKRKILDEMVTDYDNALEKNFELAKKFVAITKSGKVEVKIKSELNGKEQILLYLIGKMYAHEAGLSDYNSADNKELMNELGIREGSLLPWLKRLRDEKRISQVKVGGYVHHAILPNLIEKTLKEVEAKLGK